MGEATAVVSILRGIVGHQVGEEGRDARPEYWKGRLRPCVSLSVCLPVRRESCAASAQDRQPLPRPASKTRRRLSPGSAGSTRRRLSLSPEAAKTGCPRRRLQPAVGQATGRAEGWPEAGRGWRPP